MNVSFSMFLDVTLRTAPSPDRKTRGVTTVRAFASITAIRAWAWPFQGGAATLRKRSTAAAGSPFSDSKISPMRNWPWAPGSLPGNLLARLSQAAMASSHFFCVA